MWFVAEWKCPAGGYVDDFFGISRQGLKHTGGSILTFLGKLLGFPRDKSGAIVAILTESKATSAQVADEKPKKWAEGLAEIRNQDNVRQ